MLFHLTDALHTHKHTLVFAPEHAEAPHVHKRPGTQMYSHTYMQTFGYGCNKMDDLLTISCQNEP